MIVLGLGVAWNMRGCRVSARGSNGMNRGDKVIFVVCQAKGNLVIFVVKLMKTHSLLTTPQEEEEEH